MTTTSANVCHETRAHAHDLPKITPYARRQGPCSSILRPRPRLKGPLMLPSSWRSLRVARLSLLALPGYLVFSALQASCSGQIAPIGTTTLAITCVDGEVATHLPAGDVCCAEA